MCNVIGVIPAREGSRRVPYKNRKEMCGKPLIGWTIEQALKCTFLDDIILTTDDLEIIKYSNEKYPKVHTILRPKEIATDTSPAWEYLFHVVQECKLKDEDIIVLLQCTSPLRKVEQIYEAFRSQFVDSKPLVSYKYITPTILERNGAIYIFSVLDLRSTFLNFTHHIAYIMPLGDSIDIDNTWDWRWCESELRRRLEG